MQTMLKIMEVMEKGYPGGNSMKQLHNILYEFPCSLHV
jgi:hypothetical protein